MTGVICIGEASLLHPNQALVRLDETLGLNLGYAETRTCPELNSDVLVGGENIYI